MQAAYSAAISDGCLCRFSITVFRVFEYRPKVPELNRSSCAGKISSGPWMAPGPLSRKGRVLVVAGQQVDPRNVVARNQALNLVQNGGRLEGTHLRLQTVGLEPNRMAVGFARLCPARLAHIGALAGSEWDQLADIKSHGFGDAHDHFKIALRVGDLARLLHELQVAAGVGEGARLLVGVGRRQNDIGHERSLGQKHLLHHQERIGQGEGINREAANGIRAHDIERLQLAALRGLDHLGKAETRGGRNAAPLFMEFAGVGNAMVSRQQVGVETHVGRAAGVGVVGQADELRARNAQAELHQRSHVVPANLRSENNDEVLLAAQLLAQRAPAFTIGLVADDGVGRRIVSRKVGGDFAFRTRGNLGEAGGLAPQLDRL